MVNNIEIVELISQITRQRRLEKEFVVNSLKDAIELAIRKKMGRDDYPVEVQIDARKGNISITVEKKVVDKVEDPDLEISLEEARKLDPEVQVGQKIKVPIPMESFGRGIVYRIQNTFLQRIREAERQHIYKNFKDRLGETITGVIQKIDKTGVYVSLGNAEALIPPEEQIPGEKYKQGGSIKALILKVEEGRKKRPQIILSRTHPDFLRRLMEFEIPEISEGTVEIKNVARIPGKRAKIAVRSKDPKVDPVGACIGIRGTRIQPVVRELSGEKIDVVKWHPDIVKYAAQAMSPAEPTLVYEEGDHIIVVVPDEKVPEAKGKEAQNVLLASRLVGKDIIVVPLSEHKPPKDAVSILELDIPEEVRDNFARNGVYVFKEVPSLAEIMEFGDVDEKTAYKILEMIEEKLAEKRGGKLE